MVPAALLKKLSIRFLKEFATTPSVAKSITIIATNALIATAAIITDQQAVPVPVPGITDHWIQQYGQPYQIQHTKSNIIFLLILSLCWQIIV